jgi:hypothetical protein
MTTAMMTECLAGLVRAAGILLTAIISAEFIYFLLLSESMEAGENFSRSPYRSKTLISGAFFQAKEINACNPYRFKNESKLTAKALGFIFFIYPGNLRMAICDCKNHSSATGNLFSNSEKNYSSIYPGNDHSSTMRRNDLTRKMFTVRTMQNPTICL